MKLVFGKSSNGKQPAMVIAGAVVLYSGTVPEIPATPLAVWRYVLNDKTWEYVAADGAWQYRHNDKDWTQ